jgi:hypothetical protein
MDRQDMATGASAGPESKLYPQFVPNQDDMEQLAQSYLQEFVERDFFSFLTGCADGDGILRAESGFERVVQFLGQEARQRMIERLDDRMARDDDRWQVYKYAFGGEFWTRPADLDAVLRVAALVPEPLSDEDGDRYGYFFIETLRAAQAENPATKSQKPIPWKREGV